MNCNLQIELDTAFSDVYYFDAKHQYFIGGKPVRYSVSSFIQEFSPTFKTDEIATRKAEKENVDKETLLKEWAFKRDMSTVKGTALHMFLEKYLNRAFHFDIQAEIQKLKDQYPGMVTEEHLNIIRELVTTMTKFADEWRKEHIILKSEFVIGDKELQIGGMIDNLSWNTKTNSLVIFDYKTNNKFTHSNFFQRYYPPIDHLDKCMINTYSLQVHFYKYLIERNTSLTVKDCNLVWFNDGAYEIIPAKDLSNEVKMLLNS